MKRPEIEEVKEIWRTLSKYNEIEEKVINQQIKWYGPIPRFAYFVPNMTKHYSKIFSIHREDSSVKYYFKDISV